MKISSLMITTGLLATNVLSASWWHSNPSNPSPAPNGSYFVNAPQDQMQMGHPAQAMGLDHRMLSDIEHAIDNSKNPERFRDVHINAFRGVVTLSGSVASEKDGQELHDYIIKTPGFQAIHDHLVIQNPQEMKEGKGKISYMDPQTAKVSDAELTANVQQALQESFQARKFKDVAFEVESGIVNLHGTVASNADKDEISQKIMKIPGVVSVEDHLTVKQ